MLAVGGKARSAGQLDGSKLGVQGDLHLPTCSRDLQVPAYILPGPTPNICIDCQARDAPRFKNREFSREQIPNAAPDRGAPTRVYNIQLVRSRRLRAQDQHLVRQQLKQKKRKLSICFFCASFEGAVFPAGLLFANWHSMRLAFRILPCD